MVGTPSDDAGQVLENVHDLLHEGQLVSLK